MITISKPDCFRWTELSDESLAHRSIDKTSRICVNGLISMGASVPNLKGLDSVGHQITAFVLNDYDMSSSWNDYQQKLYWYGMADAPLQDCDLKPLNIELHSDAVAMSSTEPYSRLIEAKRVWKVVRLESQAAHKFRRLSAQWYRETGMISMIHKKSMHPAYQGIIGMGKDALPFIFKELKQKKGHWFWALCAITEEDPAEGTHKFNEALNAWLEWGKNNGYL